MPIKIHPEMQALLADIERHRKITKEPRSVFGVNAAGDGHFITRIEQGRQPRLETVTRVRAYMARRKAAR